MSVKKIGPAKINLKEELWVTPNGGEFLNSRRLVDQRPDVKAVKARHKKFIQVDTPSRRKPNKREAYFQALEAYQKDLRECLGKVYTEIFEESFSYPILLNRHRDFDHKSDWRYCLFEGVVYQFDRPAYSDEEMIQQIRKQQGAGI